MFKEASKIISTVVENIFESFASQMYQLCFVLTICKNKIADILDILLKQLTSCRYKIDPFCFFCVRYLFLKVISFINNYANFCFLAELRIFGYDLFKY